LGNQLTQEHRRGGETNHLGDCHAEILNDPRAGTMGGPSARLNGTPPPTAPREWPP
jgi:hypothetical protein